MQRKIKEIVFPVVQRPQDALDYLLEMKQISSAVWLNRIPNLNIRLLHH